MKKAIKLLLISWLLMQIVTPLLLLPFVLYRFISSGTADVEQLVPELLVPAQLIATGLVFIYLWRGKHINRSRENWSGVSFSFNAWSLLALLSASWLLNVLSEHLSFMPNIMEESVKQLTSNGLGILCIALLGPIMEELLFRGAITDSLLRSTSPKRAIWVSAVMFAVFHLNPAQMIPALFMGILFAWVYYKSGSLIPPILMHVVNNSVAVALAMAIPDVDYLSEVMSPQLYWGITVGAVPLLVWAIWRIKGTKTKEWAVGEASSPLVV